MVNQYATETPEGVRHNWATGRFDLAGGWKAYDHGGNAGSFSLLVRSGVNFGVSQKFNLSDSLGSGLVLNCLPGGGPQEPITLNILYYRQDFYRKKFAFYVGGVPGLICTSDKETHWNKESICHEVSGISQSRL